jgi:hypothetical protein
MNVDSLFDDWCIFINSSRNAYVSRHRNLPCFYGFL